MSDTLFSQGTVITSPWLNDANTSTYNLLINIHGTGNDITATGPMSLTVGYPTGVFFSLIPTAANTGPATLNISGLGVKPLLKQGIQPLAANDLAANVAAYVLYDGTEFQLLNPLGIPPSIAAAIAAVPTTGRLLGVQAFTANATYTPTAGTTRVLVKVLGGGGGGGGAGGSGTSTQVTVSAGGGAGAYAEGFFTSGFSGAAVTVGAGGGGGLGAGLAGGTSSFGALLSCTGGLGGSAGTAGAASFAAGVNGGTSSGGYLNLNGASSESIIGSFAAGYVKGGNGAASAFGSGGYGGILIATPGSNAQGGSSAVAGAGGGGSVSTGLASSIAGGAGTTGRVIIYEYS